METQNKPAAKRLQSLDALRGFDMFWIMGGGGIFVGLATLTGWPVFQWWAEQLEHVPWNGFRFYDMIFPLFLFIAGISFPFSMAKRIAMNESRQSIYKHVIGRLIMPGKLNHGNHDPEGLFSTVPAIGTALLGIFTGEFMHSKYLNDKPLKKVLFLVLAGIALMIIGKIWDLTFPINKNLWTSSFVCFVGGLSLLLFAIFYLIIDVWQYKKLAFFFVVIGMNPITIYLTGRIVNFRSVTRFFFEGITDLLPETWTPLIEGIGITTVAWVFLYILYKKKIFPRV